MNADLTNSPHQTQSANGYTYGYDTHGNQTVASHGDASKTRSTLYSLDERAYEMTKGSNVTRFWYGVGGDRYKRQDISVAGTKTTINVANLEIETLGGVTTTRRTVAGVFLEVTVSRSIPKLLSVTNKYLHHDQLGNIVRITDANGVVLEKLDFDAFGARRNTIDPRQTFVVAGQVSNGTVTLPGNQILTLYATKRGFTGHEMVDGFDIVHMNGRIYDNMIGRFLQADPVVQDPSNTQNFNRYTYVWNNPLAFTDPSGYSSVGNMFRQILAIAIVVVGNILIPGSATLWQSMLLGFLSGTVTGGLKGGLMGAFSAGLFYGIGTGFDKLVGKFAAGTLTAMKVLAHGVAGGVMSVMQGGKFGHGFASAGVTQAFANSIDTIDAGNLGFSAQRTVAAAMVGGTASVLSGGKFASGAVTGAFSRAFNEEIAEHKKSRIIEEGQEIINRLVGEAKADPNANLNLNKREIGILSAFSAYEVKAHSNSVLGYSWLPDKVFEMYTWSRGDSIFAAFSTRKFNVTGFGENFDGIYGGNDMNYMKFGMMYAEANRSATQMRKVISSYNIDQNDAAQIPRATPWGNFGYKFHNEFFGAKK